MSFRNKQLNDLMDRLRTQTTKIVTNRLPVECGVFIPRPNPHDGSQLDVVLCQILQVVVCVIAPKTYSRQHHDVPAVQTFTTAVC